MTDPEPKSEGASEYLTRVTREHYIDASIAFAREVLGLRPAFDPPPSDASVPSTEALREKDGP